MGGVPLRKALHAEGFIKRKMVRTEKVRGGRNGWSSSAVWQKKQVFVWHLSNTEVI